MSRFYVTTPIYYVNDVPHLGTAYSTIVVDALRRYHLLRGDDARMLTGTDEHGLKIERVARERGKAPLEFATEMSARFKETWPKLEIAPDDFIRTTEERHTTKSEWFWDEIRRKNPGDIYLGDYEGWYCVGCEDLKTEKELEQPGNLCAIHKTPVERVKEESYFFKLSAYGDRLLEYYEKNPDFIKPESRRNEVVSFVRGGLRDLSISRTTFRWGIPVPGDPKHVMYVWFDALTNYWTALQDTDEHKKYWTDGNIVHIVGKDILRFHAVYWPALLMSAGLTLPKTVYAHGFLTFNGQKMSKSLRNAVEPVGIAHKFGEYAGGDEAGADVVRYQLLRAIAFGQDGDFDLAAMIERYNADLGKNLGNLVSRTLGLCARLTESKVPASATLGELEAEFLGRVAEGAEAVAGEWEALALHRALELTWAVSAAANQYVDRAAPWNEAKKGDRGRVDAILFSLFATLRILSVMVAPVLPRKSEEMRRQIGLEPLELAVGSDVWKIGFRQDGALAEWTAPWPNGGKMQPASPLFPTLDEPATRALLAALTPQPESPEAATSAPGATAIPAAPAPGAATPTAAITYDQFSTVDLRVGLVRTCERVPKKDKLLRLEVDLGEPQPRIIIAGLALSFTPDTLVGRKVVVVANLAPRDFGKGLVSHGMLLATGPSEKLILATVDGDAAAGSKLK